MEKILSVEETMQNGDVNGGNLTHCSRGNITTCYRSALYCPGESVTIKITAAESKNPEPFYETRGDEKHAGFPCFGT